MKSFDKTPKIMSGNAKEPSILRDIAKSTSSGDTHHTVLKSDPKHNVD